jgi:hypothetical protein
MMISPSPFRDLLQLTTYSLTLDQVVRLERAHEAMEKDPSEGPIPVLDTPGTFFRSKVPTLAYFRRR